MRSVPQLQIIKIGGSLVTNKARPASFCKPRTSRLGQELSKVGAPFILLHGTGSFGKPPARQYGYDHLGYLQRSPEIVSEVSNLLHELRGKVVTALREVGMRAFSVPPAGVFRTCRGSVTECNVRVLRDLIERSVVPVLSGDLVIDDEYDFSVCSSDAMAAWLAIEFSAERLIFATDAPGVLSGNAKRAVISELRYEDLDNPEFLKDDEADVSGGMTKKLAAGFSAARVGIETWIIDGRVEGRLENMVKGNPVPATRLLGG
jgi:isopentenyl phosphate kinase